MIAALIFYMFAGLAVASGVMVISARNPVHSVLFLILCFFNAAGLFLLLGAEFLAMVLVVVYVGAVAVMFLFVVMMLDINFLKLREGVAQYLPTGAVIGLVLLVELAVVFGGWAFAPDVEALLAAPIPPTDQMTNTEALGRLIYTNYVFLFQASGVILLVAMIGAILLTHRTRTGVRKQKIYDQVGRTAANSVEIRKVSTGGGI
ncbi:NADH-quinone oxidoreductase subunit J [Magnetospirillum sulfuroxidans]|uniref:NADH-quinone oxidoreductase subunit J n=1 Tax=Magnetospirillum sulfuroxidans TaxID=611300 RepID=A0ABS5I8J5_9PROT|nr:NADH-quinone oxidoreductase subunit J [Magnetospirillum sulfuroxidans]MBR9970749.1 NADH-quinone oxidoreductase subunit J [Magnetospirillum sulfuroxidans]